MMVGEKLGKMSALPCHHPRLRRPRTILRCYQRRVEGWSGRGYCFEGLLPDCPVSHRPQHSVLEENGERGQRSQKQSVRIER
jgi:hypothetical protein